MSDYLRYLPYFLYASPFVVAAVVLVKAKLNEFGEANDTDEDTSDVITRDDPMMHEVRSRPIYKEYVSYGM